MGARRKTSSLAQLWQSLAIAQTMQLRYPCQPPRNRAKRFLPHARKTMIPDLPLEELARRYDNGRPSQLPRWQKDSRLLRENAACTLDIAYGPKPRNRYDLFTPDGPAPAGGWACVIFIHGGYWQRLCKEDWSIIARPFIENGMAAAIVGYTLCPQVSLRSITQEIVQAIAHLWKNAASLHIDRARLSLAGHSAGGHLTAWCLCEDWSAHGLPASPFAKATAISGLFDLEPLTVLALNNALQLSNTEALALSPAYLKPRVSCPLTATVGGAETPEFLRQNHLISQHWPDVNEWVLPGLNHFTIIDELTRADTPLFAQVRPDAPPDTPTMPALY